MDKSREYQGLPERTHEMEHDGTGSLKCNLCGFTTDDASAVARHVVENQFDRKAVIRLGSPYALDASR